MTERTNNKSDKATTTAAGDVRHEVFASRIPSNFTEESVQRLLEAQLGEGSVVAVGLKYVDTGAAEYSHNKEQEDFQDDNKKKIERPHQGYAFLQLASAELVATAVKLGLLKGTRKASSKKKHTIYLQAVQVPTTDNPDDPNAKDGGDDDQQQQDLKSKHLCFLWQHNRCPYGDDCKFEHSGPGGCAQKQQASTKVKKCWDFKKGKCKLGEACPFSHDFEVVSSEKNSKDERSQKEKDCINWKTKGKCRKGDACPYKHDEAVQERALAKRNKRKQPNDTSGLEEAEQQLEPYKRAQPLSVRVFGLNYATTEPDLHEFFATCGKIHKIDFPTFEDSGRSKGFAEVLFTSPKAVTAAVQLHETELQGRWLSVQVGKMYLKQWEEHQDYTNSVKKVKREQEETA